MPVTDVATWIGGYPYRHLRDPSAGWLVRQMDRLAIDQAWVSCLPALLFRDPASSTPELLEHIKHHHDRLHPVPTIHPGLPRWEQDLNDAVALRAPAVRVHPKYLGLDPVGGEMRVLAGAAAAVGLPLLLTVRLEDPRQLHPLDTAGELPAAAIRGLVRSDPQLSLW